MSKILDRLKERRLKKQYEQWMDDQFRRLTLRILQDDIKRSEKHKKMWRQIRERKSKNDYVV
jgi:hypothetical protein